MNARTAFLSIACLATGAIAALSAPAPAAASQARPEVAVPRVPAPHVPVPGGGIAGCWAAHQPIYGPYAFSFCSNGRYGSYQVRGGGLYCNGSVNVSPGGGTVTVRLSRSRCNGWTDWSADYLVCRTSGAWAGYPGGHAGSRAAAEVAVPHVPAPRVPVATGRLDCTYFPVASGYHPIGLAMFRS